MIRRPYPLPSVLLLVTAACLAEGPAASPPAPRITDQVLRAAAAEPGGWITHGRDYSNQRHSPLTAIDRTTVRFLRPLWRHDLDLYFRSSTRNESTPLLLDERLYYTDLKNLVIAVDARSGRELWRYRPELGPVALCCGMVNRGVAAYGDKLYLATLDARVIALNRADGSVAWDVRAADPSGGYSFTMAPLAADGKIIVGASGGEFQIRGFVDAYDPESGRRIWRFWTTASPEEGGWYGRWSATTPEGDPLPRDIAAEKRDSARFAEAWRVGGAPVWSTPAYDPRLGLLYVGTGEPSALDGRIPPGDNLYSTSLLAIEAGTGRLRWYYQMVPHNHWNLDACNPPVLFDLPVGDSMVPALAHAGKTGWVYILDRRTGRLIRRSEPFVPLANIFPRPTREGALSSPGVFGGSSWPPAAYAPETGLLYVLGSHLPMRYARDSVHGTDADPFVHARFHRVPGIAQYGVLSALDVATGRIRWQRRARKHLMYGGALATAGGLVFYGDPQGWLNALDAVTGDSLWRGRAAHGPLGPPVTFEVDGRQRIAVTSQSGLTLFGLPDSVPH